MRQLKVCLGFLACAAIAPAQMLPGGSGGDFKTANVKADDGRMNFETGQIDWLRGNAYIELVPATPDKPTLRIRAGEVKFNYSGQDSNPSSIVMTGSVNVDQAPFKISAERGEWQGNVLTLTGKIVTVKDDKGATYQGSRMTFNQETGELEVKDLNISDMPMSKAAGGAAGGKEEKSPYAFTPADIKDWPGFISKLQQQSAAAEPSPGKQIVSQLSPEVRKQLPAITNRQVPNAGTQNAIVSSLNKVLKEIDLYDEASWKGVSVAPDAEALLKKSGNLTGAEVVQLNRRLIEAAYPDAIAKKD